MRKGSVKNFEKGVKEKRNERKNARYEVLNLGQITWIHDMVHYVEEDRARHQLN